MKGCALMIEKLFSNPIYAKHRELLLSLLDLGIVVVSFFLAYWIRSDFRIPSFSQVNPPVYFLAIAIVLIVYAIGFFVFKIQKSLWKYIGPVETIRIGFAVVLSTVVLLLCTVITTLPRSFSSIVVTGGLLTAILMYSTRVSYRLYRRHTMKGGKERNAIIIGAGDGGYILLKELVQNDKFDIKVVGFVDDKRNGNVISGYKVLGSTEELPQIVNKFKVEEAFIAIPSASKAEIRRIYEICQKLKLEIKIMK